MQYDPASLTNRASGVIERTNDRDRFYFTTTGGIVRIDMNLPSYHVAYHDPASPFEASVGNLDARLTLYSADGTVIETSQPPESFSAAIVKTLPGGLYYVEAEGAGGYGDLGQYTIEMREISGPQVVDSQLEYLNASQGRINVTFNKPLGNDLADHTTLALKVGNELHEVPIYDFEVGQFDRTYTFTFDRTPEGWDDGSMTLGKYRLTIEPGVTDRFGNLMNQDGSYPNGEDHDGYSKNFGELVVTLPPPQDGVFDVGDLPPVVLTQAGAAPQTPPTFSMTASVATTATDANHVFAPPADDAIWPDDVDAMFAEWPLESSVFDCLFALDKPA